MPVTTLQQTPKVQQKAKSDEQLTPERKREVAERGLELAMKAFEYHTRSQGHDKNAMAIIRNTLKSLQAHLGESDSDQARIDRLKALSSSEHKLALNSPDGSGALSPALGRWRFHELDCNESRGWHERYVLRNGNEMLLVGGPKNAHNAVSELANELRDAMALDRATAESALAAAIGILDKINPPITLPPAPLLPKTR